MHKNRQIYIYYPAVTEYSYVTTELCLLSRPNGSTAEIISNQYFLSLKALLTNNSP